MRADREVQLPFSDRAAFINSAILSGISSRNRSEWSLRNSPPMLVHTAFRSAGASSRAMPTNANQCGVFPAHPARLTAQVRDLPNVKASQGD
jgi:hypothetical protein